jgi:hypothetical protein
MSPTPLFILGIAQRSGTNYLREVLTLHPECARSRHTGEDFLVQAIPHLEQFICAASSFWNPSWGNDPALLKAALARALTSYLTPDGCTATYVVTKTPSCTNADKCLEVFDHAYVIIIIRNGQDLVESFIRSFPADFSYAARLWAAGAREVLRVRSNQAHMRSKRILEVKYEDLYQHHASTMKSIFDFLGVNESHFDYAQSEACAVRGSSTYRSGAQQLSWAPIPKGADFCPLQRSSEWTRWKHYRFNWIAGKLSKELGYPLHYETKSISYCIYNLLSSTLEMPVRCVRIIRDCLQRSLPL